MSSKKIISIAYTSLLFLSWHAVSQIYKYIDDEGNVTYSDSPPLEEPDLEPAELPDVIYQPAIKVSEYIPHTEVLSQDIDVSINTPVNDTTIHGSKSSLSVSASTSRPLNPDESARLLVNGQVLTTGTSLSWSVRELIRGECSLKVEILDKSRSVISSSSTIVVHIKRNIAH